MRSKCTLLVTMVAAVAFSASTARADSPHEKLVGKMLTAMEDMTKVFQSITDADSAKKAKPALNRLTDTFEELGKKAKDLPQPSDEVKKAIQTKYEARLKKSAQAFVAAAIKAARNPEVQKELKDVGLRLQKIGKAMQQISW